MVWAKSATAKGEWRPCVPVDISSLEQSDQVETIVSFDLFFKKNEKKRKRERKA